MNFLGIPLWERRVNGFQKPVSNGWNSFPTRRSSDLQLLQQLAYYAQDIAPYFEQRDAPLATS